MAALRLEDAFRFLLGKWRVEREVSGTATMTGTVDVRACSEDVAEYGERMQVQTEAGATFAGSVRYTVRRTSRGFALEFPHTGALFQEVEFSRAEGGELRGSAVHDCEEDRYESMYVLGPRREMLVQHAVTGPRKDYVSVARFVRVGGVGAEFGRATWSAVKSEAHARSVRPSTRVASLRGEMRGFLAALGMTTKKCVWTSLRVRPTGGSPDRRRTGHTARLACIGWPGYWQRGKERRPVRVISGER